MVIICFTRILNNHKSLSFCSKNVNFFKSKFSQTFITSSSVKNGNDHDNDNDNMNDNAFENFSAKTLFMFPGQGVQYVGMGKDFVNDNVKSKFLFDQASDILGYNLLEKCLNGPKSDLDSTAISQPAIFVCSVAAIEKLKVDLNQNQMPAVEATAALGLSLGEYTALYYAGAISFEDAIKIIKVRGESMQTASDLVPSAMVSIMGLEKFAVEEMCRIVTGKTGSPIQIANYLDEITFTVAGGQDACQHIIEEGRKTFGARIVRALPVSGAFHTTYMESAVPYLRSVLETIEIKQPIIPVLSNVDGKPHSDPKVIKEILSKQLISPVLWHHAIENCLSKNDTKYGYELGPGKVCTGILSRIIASRSKSKKVKSKSVNNLEEEIQLQNINI